MASMTASNTVVQLGFQTVGLKGFASEQHLVGLMVVQRVSYSAEWMGHTSGFEMAVSSAVHLEMMMGYQRVEMWVAM